MVFNNFILTKKCPIYKNRNISIINLHSNKQIHNGVCRFNEMRQKTDVFFCPKSKFLTKTTELITNPTNKESCLYYDDESVVQFNDVFIFSLACSPCDEPIREKTPFKVRWVVVDKTHCSLIIFESYDDLVNYVRGNNYKFFYRIFLTEFCNIGLESVKKGKNETHQNTNTNKKIINPNNGMLETYNPLQLTQMKLFRNDVYDVMNYNKNRPLSSLAEHISVDIKITRLYKFASAHENKMRIFKQTIEEVVGFRIMY